MNDNEPRAIICTRVGDPHWRKIEGSTPSPCSRCEHQVMVSPATRQLIQPGDKIICIECAVAIAEARGTKWVDPGRSPDQLAELVANGHEPRRFYADHQPQRSEGVIMRTMTDEEIRERLAVISDEVPETVARLHAKLARGQVWCKKCGRSMTVDSTACLRRGWPKCCGETMTIDAPEERQPQQPKVR